MRRGRRQLPALPLAQPFNFRARGGRSQSPQFYRDVNTSPTLFVRRNSAQSLSNQAPPPPLPPASATTSSSIGGGGQHMSRMHTVRYRDAATNAPAGYGRRRPPSPAPFGSDGFVAQRFGATARRSRSNASNSSSSSAAAGVPMPRSSSERAVQTDAPTGGPQTLAGNIAAVGRQVAQGSRATARQATDWVARLRANSLDSMRELRLQRQNASRRRDGP